MTGLSPNDSALQSMKLSQHGIDNNGKFTTSICPCLQCKKINSSIEKWENFKPTTPHEIILRNAINNII